MSGQEVRDIYVEGLIELAEKDERIILLEADLMTAAKTVSFKNRFPDRLINVGVAEANMIGVAAGLSAMGKIPFTHTFTPFATRRCFDQIFISIAYSDLNVKMMGSDPGVSAELNGGTHMSFEDVGIMRNIPEMVIYEPVDGNQLKKALPQILEHKGPVYLRMIRKYSENVINEDIAFKLGMASTLVEGSDATIFASGLMVRNSLEATAELKEEGIKVRLVNMHTIKPIDQEAVRKAARETGAIVTAENHNIINGLGSAVAEILVENDPVPMKRIGVKDHFGEVGTKEFLMEKYGMTARDIAKAVREVIKRK
ncbi:MAG: transketolase family protein [Halanaerobiales bacterium]|nr:transketolase family protein [Halanaerobiales bacterium]